MFQNAQEFKTGNEIKFYMSRQWTIVIPGSKKYITIKRSSECSKNGKLVQYLMCMLWIVARLPYLNAKINF